MPGNVLLENLEGVEGSRVQGCAGVYIYELLGTNDLSFTNVLDQYAVSLKTAGWQLVLETDHGRSFTTSDRINVEVSDNYRFLPFNKATILEGQKKFKTLFLLALTTPVEPDVPAERCR